MPTTSTLGPALGVLGLEILFGSPATAIVCNVEDIDLPTSAKTVEVTNVGDTWTRRFPTLLDMGKITFKIYWIPTEATHKNAAGGLRYALITQALTTFKILYPDTPGSFDTFPGYITNFHVTGKVGDVFHAAIEVSNSGAPTLA
jgi:hypothetical protein